MALTGVVACVCVCVVCVCVSVRGLRLGRVLFCLVLSREFGNGCLGLLSGTLRDDHRDPFPHSLLSTREFLGRSAFRSFAWPQGLRRG